MSTQVVYFALTKYGRFLGALATCVAAPSAAAFVLVACVGQRGRSESPSPVTAVELARFDAVSNGGPANELASPPSDSRSRWERVLPSLNAPGAASPELVDPFTHGVEVDLPALYSAELGAVREEWRAEAGPMTRSQERAQKERVNAFFHARIEALNSRTTTALDGASRSHRGRVPDRVALAERILTEVRAHPVARQEGTERFDASGQIGFCFGRALLVHHRLLGAGVDPRHLAKIFVHGELSMEARMWRFHVATMVRDAASGYLVIDPLLERPLPYGEWIARNARYDIKSPTHRARFYVSVARKFLPAFPSHSLAQFEDPALKGWFDALSGALE